MAAYLIVNAKVTDAEGLDRYRAAVGPTLAGHEVEILVATNGAETIEGDPAGQRVVVMKFPSAEAAKAWYHSEAYQAVVGMRLAATEGFALLAEGR